MTELEAVISKVTDDSNITDSYFERGCIFFEKGLHLECISDMLYYISHDESNPNSYLYLAKSLEAIRNPLAIDYFKEYSNRCPEDVDALIELAEMYFDSGRYKESLAEFNKAISRGVDASILEPKANILASSGNKEAAKMFGYSNAEPKHSKGSVKTAFSLFKKG